jgi:hypothetical protein
MGFLRLEKKKEGVAEERKEGIRKERRKKKGRKKGKWTRRSRRIHGDHGARKFIVLPHKTLQSIYEARRVEIQQQIEVDPIGWTGTGVT